MRGFLSGVAVTAVAWVAVAAPNDTALGIAWGVLAAIACFWWAREAKG